MVQTLLAQTQDNFMSQPCRVLVVLVLCPSLLGLGWTLERSTPESQTDIPKQPNTHLCWIASGPSWQAKAKKGKHKTSSKKKAQGKKGSKKTKKTKKAKDKSSDSSSSDDEKSDTKKPETDEQKKKREEKEAEAEKKRQQKEAEAARKKEEKQKMSDFRKELAKGNKAGAWVVVWKVVKSMW